MGAEGAVAAGAATLDAAADARIVGLVDRAAAGQLVIYAGAGLSLDSGLPTGRTLSRAVFTRLTEMGIAIGAIDPDDLVAVADAAAAAPGGLNALEAVAIDAFPFTTAPWNAAHRALALLLLEGAVELLTTNWDTCIERAAAPERVTTVVTPADRASMKPRSLLKVHGCIDRRGSLLVTSAQLALPPLWAATAVAAGLSQATVVFLGIGDVAPYVQQGLEKVVAELGTMDNVVVVTPSIETRWEESNWSSLLPHLPDTQKWGLSAADFCCGLLRAWLNAALSNIRATGDAMGVSAVPGSVSQLLSTLRAHDADRVLSWLRRSAAAPRPGVTVARADPTSQALLALAIWTSDTPLAAVPTSGPIRLANKAVDLLICDVRTAGAAAAQEALRRATSYRQEGLLGPSDDLTVICSGQTGPLLATSQSILPTNLIDEPGSDLIGGAAVQVIASHAILDGAAA